MKTNKAEIIDIYAINDYHGLVESHDHYSAVSMFSKLLELKSRNPGQTLIVSSGDMFESPALMRKTPGHLTIQLMNLVNTAAMAVGNHDFDWIPRRKSFFYELQKQLHCPILSCNLLDKRTGQRPEPFQSSVLLNLPECKLALIGLTTEECAQVCLKEELGDIVVNDAVRSLKTELTRVKEQGAELIVVLGHIGAFQDENTAVIRGEAASLLNHFDGRDFQALITAHTHQYIAGTVNGISIVQGGAYGDAIGHLEVSRNSGGNRFRVEPGVIYVNEAEGYDQINPRIKRIWKRKEENETKISQIGFATGMLSMDYERETFWGRFVAEAMREHVDADLGLINPGAFRQHIKAGPLFMADIVKNLPFDNTVCKVLLRGKAIKGVLQQPINPSMGRLQSSGLKTLDEETQYTVALSNFLAGGGDGYADLTAGTLLEDTGFLVREVVASRVRALGKIIPF